MRAAERGAESSGPPAVGLSQQGMGAAGIQTGELAMGGRACEVGRLTANFQ
jgi:hypothetical protein